MKRKTAINILLLSLLGLMTIQFWLLMIGGQLEKQRFDERVRIGLQEMNVVLENDTLFAEALGNSLLANDWPENKVPVIQEKLRHLLAQNLEKKGITANFTFAITNKYGSKTFLASDDFVEKSFHFDYYNLQLSDQVLAKNKEERILHLDIPNVYHFLLGQLKYLVIPSLFFLAALLVCLWFLVRMLRKEERLNSVKNEFINNLTHELKTPVFSISLASTILKEHLEKGNLEKAHQFLAMIGKENEKLKTHIDKVLELATLESPTYQLEKQPANLNALVEEVINGFKIKVENQRGKLQINLAKQPLMTHLDPVHFKNVIQNLLENALKYSPKAIDIQVSTKQLAEHLQLIVSDKGAGILPEFQPKIFDKFYRVPNENLHEVKGFGLGLNYVKKIVEAHGGEISVASEIGKGASFLIKIPVDN